VRALSSTGEVVSYTLNPYPKQLGQKYKNQFPAIRKALLELNAEKTAQALLAGLPVSVRIGLETFEILPGEVEVRAEARAGLVVASEGPYLAALKTELTPELLLEGLARDFVRRVQEFRKQANFDIADRIRLSITATPRLAEAIQVHREYIMGETLAVELKQNISTEAVQQTSDSEVDKTPVGGTRATIEFDNEWAGLEVFKV
jgi:isoleucyl-tRNA synthetase